MLYKAHACPHAYTHLDTLIHTYTHAHMYTLAQAMDDANLKKSEIDEIVLVGGSTRIPKVCRIQKRRFRFSSTIVLLYFQLCVWHDY